MGSDNGETEEVSVYCRVRPISTEDSEAGEERCVEVIDDETIRLAPPESSRAYFNGKGQEYTFKTVYDEDSTQTEVFQSCGFKLVNDLFQGKNGLMFTYGVTGSGKTYTMQGTPTDGGLMTRSLDVIFNSIDGRQTSRKFVIESDKLNDFQIQSVADAAIRQQREMMADLKSNRGGYGLRG